MGEKGRSGRRNGCGISTINNQHSSISSPASSLPLPVHGPHSHRQGRRSRHGVRRRGRSVGRSVAHVYEGRVELCASMRPARKALR